MTKKLTALAALLTLCVAASQSTALAATGSEPTPDASNDLQVQRLEPGRNLKVIYSNFSDDWRDLYYAAGYLVTSRDSEWGQNFSVAAPFTPLKSAVVRKIVLPLHALGYVPQVVEVSFREDEGGMPGAVIRRFSVPAPLWSDWYDKQVVQVKGIPVTAGTQYWIAATAPGDNNAYWNFNSINLYGTFARKFNASKWESFNDALPAFSVLGDWD
jgi:hypothetical protein